MGSETEIVMVEDLIRSLNWRKQRVPSGFVKRMSESREGL